MNTLRIGTCLASLLLAPSLCWAQYSRAVGDTLRYSEVTNGTMTLTAPEGSVTVIKTDHDARIAVTFAEGERALAWYEALRLEQQGPMGSKQPRTDSLLGKPFKMLFREFGQLELIETPEIPAEITEMTDLTRQFEDFFITLPARNLEIGATWRDTIGSESSRAGDHFRSRHIRSYVVDRDTTIAGAPAFVIRVDQQVEIEGTSEGPEQNMKTAGKLSGAETGWAIFSPLFGRLIEWQRSGSFTGESQLSTPGMPTMIIPQTIVYDSRITLLH